ncbi:hypothetical protein NQ314_009345 [Rhamnusium bicolor]|uniref:DDE Tnp4 domain-containing protein n=1 Tax=Rhamnusium bicolor TaxID=1586634 RepID=A0AAV8Y355_9CUCU|nr:hypothetical protein NQ314_009345 [Rhamnusium bicolor]
MGGRKKMKPNVVPHIFDCQPDRKRAFSQPPRSAALKRAKRRIVDDAVASTSTLSAEDLGNMQVDQSSIQFVQSPSDANDCGEPLTTAINKKDMTTQARPKVRSKNIQCNLHFGVTVVLSHLNYWKQLYMGLPDYAFYTFQLLQKYCKIQNMYIFLTLKKIRTGQSLTSLADDFDTSESNASKIFSKSLPVISKYLRKCILTAQPTSVKSNLPLAFRARYNNVLCIIDCLEIEIEKPSDSVTQSLTWSEYKKCNTLKYLISCTPDGIVNFISTGYGRRTSDAVIIENCGFLDVIPQVWLLWRDRGFKHIEHLLVTKGCVLVRPPSVSASLKSSKAEVLGNKKNSKFENPC